MLDAHEAAFLRSIAEEHDGHAARLVFADWLDEHGEAPRAEFLRVQCELAAAKLGKKRRHELLLRERALLDAHRRPWCGAIGLPVEDVCFEGGLISRLWLSMWEGGNLLKPPYAQRLVTLTELDLSGLQLGDDGLTAFAQKASFPALRKLILSNNAITAKGVTALAAASGLPCLDTLYLFQNPVGADARGILERSTKFHLTNLDLAERADGYCMSPGEAEMARRQYLREDLLPVVERHFQTNERLQSAMLCVAQYWADEADDAVHGMLIVSELFEPTLKGVDNDDDTSSVDPNIPNTYIKPRFGERSSSEISLWDTGARWDDNTGAIPLWAAYAPEDGSQEYSDYTEVFAPAVMFYRHGGYELLPLRRPHLDGVRPEWGWEE